MNKRCAADIDLSLAELADVSRKVEFLFSLHSELCGSDPQLALRCSRMALDLLESAGGGEACAKAQYNHAEALLITADISGATSYFTQALQYFRASGDKESMARTLNKIGAAYAQRSCYDEALVSINKH